MFWKEPFMRAWYDIHVVRSVTVDLFFNRQLGFFYQQGFFSSEFGSVIRTQSQCQIVSFFPKRGAKIPNLLQTAKVKIFGIICRATDKARKSVITHWKSVKTHWKNKQGVKIRISISQYALGVQSSAYRLSKLDGGKSLDWRCPSVCPFVNIYLQWFLLRCDKCYYKNKCLQFNTTSNSKLLLKLYLNNKRLQIPASTQSCTFFFQHCGKI